MADKSFFEDLQGRTTPVAVAGAGSVTITPTKPCDWYFAPDATSPPDAGGSIGIMGNPIGAYRPCSLTVPAGLNCYLLGTDQTKALITRDAAPT